MNNWAKLLHKENQKLKQEALLLQQQVKLVKEVKVLRNQIQSRRLSVPNAANLISNIQQSSFSEANKENCLSTNNKTGTKPTFNNSNYSNKKFLFENLKKSKNCLDEERGLLESFESYYESEEENLEKAGKCELSYAQYKNFHVRGSRRNSKMKTEENDNKLVQDDFLASKCQDCKHDHQQKPKIRTRKGSRVSSGSTLEELILRKFNCRVCDQFLYQGLPSSKCRKHSSMF